MNKTPEKEISYPSVFADMNLDDINYLLRQGRATKEDAEQLVTWWNESGKRVSRAKLRERLMNVGGCACIGYEIVIFNQ